MKTFYSIILILFGLLLYAYGALRGSGGTNMVISLFGAFVMCLGLFPLIDRKRLSEEK